MPSQENQKTVREDVAKVAAIIQEQGARLIAIDGSSGSGKTELARALAERLDATMVDLDKFLERRRGVYFPALKFNKIAERIGGLVDAGGIVIVSGLRMLDVMERIERSADLRIYVECRTPKDQPNDSIFFDAEDGYTDVLRWLSELDQEVGNYHCERKPRGTADIVYIWQREDS